jgi:hypothetical protein
MDVWFSLIGHGGLFSEVHFQFSAWGYLGSRLYLSCFEAGAIDLKRPSRGDLRGRLGGTVHTFRRPPD